MWSDGRDGRGRAVGRMDGRQDFPSGSASFLSRRSQWRTECTYATDSPRPVPGLYELGAALPFEKLLGCAKYCAEDVTISRARLRDMLHIENFLHCEFLFCVVPVIACAIKLYHKDHIESLSRILNCV